MKQCWTDSQTDLKKLPKYFQNFQKTAYVVAHSNGQASKPTKMKKKLKYAQNQDYNQDILIN